MNKKDGFTLLELMVALVLLMTAMGIIIGTFTAVLQAWRRGDELMQDLHHGDFVMDQLVSGLRSAAYFSTRPEKYGFHLEDNGSGEDASDLISWVTSGTAFMPKDSPLTKGLHRISVTLEDNEDGDTAVAIRAFAHLAEDIDDDDPDPWFISTEITGLDCQVYNKEDEEWEDEWEFTNSIPRLLKLTLYMEPLEEYGDAVEMMRVIEIPLGSDDDMAKGGGGSEKNQNNEQQDFE